MDALLALEQTLNGVQFGVFLFLVSAGLTLVFGIMNFVNLAHGSLYMVGAYYAATIYEITGSFLLGLVIIVPACLITGVLLELAVVRPLYRRDHLDQVLVTFGLILFFNEAVRIIWGPAARFMPQPEGLTGHVEIIADVPYPVYRLVIIGVGLLIALFLYLLITKTRIGMLIRAGASNRPMVGALGINITNLYTKVFGLGAVLAGIAGLMAAPVLSVQSGMGEEMLILAFVVIVIGGVGSIRGAFVASIIVGIVDTLGRTSIPVLLKIFVSHAASQTAGPALASMLIYIVMAAVLFFRPSGLFAARTG
jgi:branched-chain amino acid transport system permease protein